MNEIVDVVDLNASRVGAKRTHRLGGRNYDFNGPDPVELPFDVALRLVGNEGFEVRKKDGTVIRPKRQATTDMSGQVVSLRSDQTIATYAELSKAALLERANALPGGGHFRHNTRPEDIIQFLIAHDSDKPDVDATPKETAPSADELAEFADGADDDALDLSS